MPLCVSNSATANMVPSTLILDLNESSSRGTSSSLNDKATCVSRQSPNPKRSITFSPFATVYNVLHVNDYTDEEIVCARYDAGELETIKKTDVISTLSMMKGGLQIPDENPWYCCRGLESLTREGSTRRRANREKAWNAVLDEQDLQWEKDICEPQAISNAYAELSRDCQDAAVMKAIQDHDMFSFDTSFELKGGGGGASFACGSSAMISPRRLGNDCCCHEISSKAA
jgi:hypothetical protein